MADELDEGLTDEETVATLWSDEVAEGKHRVQEADEDAGEKLPCPVPPPPAGELIIPSRRQQLLAVWLSHKLQETKEEREGRVVPFIRLIYRDKKSLSYTNLRLDCNMQTCWESASSAGGY